jgi:hypothetical protein
MEKVRQVVGGQGGEETDVTRRGQDYPKLQSGKTATPSRQDQQISEAGLQPEVTLCIQTVSLRDVVVLRKNDNLSNEKQTAHDK